MEFDFEFDSVGNTNYEDFPENRKYVSQKNTSAADSMRYLRMFSLAAAGYVWGKPDKLCCICKICLFHILLLMAEKKKVGIIYFCSIIWT